jgi:HlyD family secretion protein
MDPADIDLKIGMTGSADVVVAMKEAAVVVPFEAVVEKKGKKYLFRVEDGKARLTEVRVGLTTEEDVEILEGIKTGDRVVIKGAEKLRDGQRVKT